MLIFIFIRIEFDQNVDANPEMVPTISGFASTFAVLNSAEVEFEIKLMSNHCVWINTVIILDKNMIHCHALYLFNPYVQ